MKREDAKRERPLLPRLAFDSPRFALIVAVLALLQFLLFLNHRQITTAHEGRVAATAREMTESGDWVVPHVNGKLRLQKPPLAYWAAAAMWRAADQLEPGLARFPAALCGLLGTLLVMDLARLTLGRGAAGIAGLIWISTWFVVDEYRKAMSDPYLAFFTLLCVWSWVKSDRTSARGALVLTFYLSAAMGTLAKGPLIFLHVLLALVPYHVIARRRPRLSIAHAIGAVLLLAISLAWPLAVMRHVPGAASVWLAELRADRAASGGKFDSPLHYLINLPLVTAPWTVFAVVGGLMTLLAKRRRERRAAWPLWWLVGTVIVFTLVPMKKNAYLLPAMPAAVLLAAAPVAWILRVRRRNTTDQLLLYGHAIVGAFLVGGVAVFALQARPLEATWNVATAAGGVVAAGVALIALRARFAARTFAVTALAFALAVHQLEAWVMPVRENRGSARGFAYVANRFGDEAPLYVIGPGLREDVLFYLGRTVPVVDDISKLPETAGEREFAIVTAEAYDAVVASGRGKRIAESPDRREPMDKLYLFRFDPIATPVTAPAAEPEPATQPATAAPSR